MTGDETETTIVLLCGPPGAGKTTLARKLLSRWPGAAYLASDELKRNRYPRLLRAAQEAAADHPVVILDATYYARVHRDRVRALGHPLLLVYLRCSLRECLRRNTQREDPIAEAAVRNLWGRFEPPTEEEDPLRIDAARASPEEAARQVESAWHRRRARRPAPGGRAPRGRGESSQGG